jgi:hypothetical protein
MSNTTYQQYYKAKFEGALLYQDFVVDISLQVLGFAIMQYSSRAYQNTVGESRTGVEIKHDEKFARTGNLWIETAEKAMPRAGDYVPAGIYRTDNSWIYVIGDYNTIFYFAKNVLRILAGKYRIMPNKTATSLGFLLPERDAEKYAATVLRPRAEVKIAKITRDLADLGRELHELAKQNPAQLSLLDQLPKPPRGSTAAAR